MRVSPILNTFNKSNNITKFSGKVMVSIGQDKSDDLDLTPFQKGYYLATGKVIQTTFVDKNGHYLPYEKGKGRNVATTYFCYNAPGVSSDKLASRLKDLGARDIKVLNQKTTG